MSASTNKRPDELAGPAIDEETAVVNASGWALKEMRDNLDKHIKGLLSLDGGEVRIEEVINVTRPPRHLTVTLQLKADRNNGRTVIDQMRVELAQAALIAQSAQQRSAILEQRLHTVAIEHTAAVKRVAELEAKLAKLLAPDPAPVEAPAETPAPAPEASGN